MNSIDQKLASTYWRNKIKDAFSINEFSLGNQKTIKRIITSEKLAYFSKLTNANIIVEHAVLISVFNALLYRYFNADGFIYSLKTGKENKPLLFRLLPAKEKTFKEYLYNIKKEVQEVYHHLDYEHKLQKKYAFEKYANYSLFYNVTSQSSKVPFTLSVKKIEGNLELEILFNNTFISDSVSNHFLETFKKWLSNLEEHVNEDIEQIPIITQPEQQQLLEGFNNTKATYSKDKTIIGLFEEQVEKTPDNVAVVFESLELTYQELNKRANQLAAYLQKYFSIQPDDLVAIKLDRSESIIIAILGVLKAGGAYVPIDINYPEQRIEYIEKDSNAKVVIDQSFLETFEKSSTKFSKSNITSKVTSKHLAYVIYTSGTTGNPKGVLIEHKSMLNLILWYTNTFNINEETNSLLLTSYTFDPSTQDILGTLIKGGRLHLISSDKINDLNFLYRFIEKKQITILNYIPNFVDNLLSKAPKIDSINSIIVGGEALSFQTKNNLINKGYKLFNNYGPTETTVDALSGLMSDSNVHIGRPISNTQAYILDSNLELLPIGVVGKLYISGDGLARGYLNRPELTKEKFIANPFIEGEKMYDTGDIAKWLPDGNIEFLGRKDRQIKLKGYRIELGEIENTMLSYSRNIHQAVAVVKDEILIVYYTQEYSIDETALNGYLKESLPSYMLPNHLKVLESIPLTPNGKIDRKQLESLHIDYSVNSNYVAPRNEIEQKLVEIWQEVLGIEKVGIHDNFFELGGHSLMVGQVINQIYKHLEGSLTYKEFFQNPIIECIAKAITRVNYSPIPQVEEQAYYPLTPSQHRIWVLSQLEGGSQAYNMSGAVSLQGKLDLDKLKKAFSELIARHDILRTYFKTNEEGEVHQYIVDTANLDFDITHHDFKGKSKDEIDRYIHKEQLIAFDLTKAPLLKVSLLQINEEEYLLSFTIHHIIGDGWSMELLTSEMVSTYNKLLENNDYKSEPLSIQYKDYSVWLQFQLTSESYKDSEVYWLDKFQGELPILSLPSFKNRPLIQTHNGKTISHQFSKDFLSKLKQFSKERDVTLFITIMSGVNALLYRYTNQDDIIIGTPIAGREHPDIEQQIGLYLNTLAIRTQLKDDFGFENLLQQQKQTLLEAYEHQIYPFDALVSRLDLKRDNSRSALFDVMVVLQNQNQVTSISSDNQNFEGIQVKPYELERKTSQVDISFAFAEENEELHLEIEYNTDIYDDFLIERMFVHFENLMSKAIDNPKDSVLSIEYITDKEKKQLLEEFNNTKVDYPKDKTIVDLFEEQVEKTPNNIAVVFEGKQLTYKELNEQSNQLAQYLRKIYTIQPDDLLGIKLDRSEQLLVTIFGILKSGAAYVPIDVNYPQERINYIEKDSNCKVVIDNEELEKFKVVKNKYSTKNLKSIAKSNHLAYVIYTSGTTGAPKGVMVEHRNVVSIYSDWKKEYELDQFTINLLQLASVSFDVFVGDICRSLLNGGKMVLPSDNTKLNPKELYSLMEKHQVSLFEGTPGLILPLLNYINENGKDYSFLKLVIFGSDSFNNQTFNAIRDTFGSTVKTINSYGVTEATIDSSYYDDYNAAFTGTTPIGKPFSNTKIYILNKKEQLAPTGVFGTIYIGGSGVSRGYYNKSALTASKFIIIPYQNENVYSTGDLARWLPDGNIEFLGRSDQQVKLRGYRIELGEIETVLKQYSGEIENTVVVVKEINKEKVLVSYYISSSSIVKSSLKEFLKKKLPEYMIPDFYIQLDHFKLTPNGKIDRNALTNISGEDSIRSEYIAPKEDIEIDLIAIWEEVLGIEKIGITDNFFELGGHSLKITKLRNLVNKKFNTTISFNDFFIESSVKDQSKLIKQSSKSIYQDIPLLPKQDNYVLSSSQRRIWMLSQFEGGNTAYNMPGIFLLEGIIDIEVMEKAFHSLIERHEALRTRFKEDIKTGEIKQIICASEENDFRLVYEATKFLNSSENYLKQLIEEESNYSFDLSNESLLRAKIIKIDNKKAYLIFVIHHIISDGWSLEIITNELFQFYNVYLNNEEHSLVPLTIHYKEYAAWEQNQLSLEKPNDSKAYWENQFQGEIPILNLPTNKKRPLYKTYTGKIVTQKLSKDVLKQFKTLCQSNNSTLFMGLVAVIKFLLYKYSNQKDIIVGTPIAGREHASLQNQIGVYINTLALRTKFKGDDTFESLLKKVKETTLSAYEHQFYPFDKLVSDLPLQRDLSRNPLFDIMVTLQNTDNGTPEINTIEGLGVSEYVSSDTVKSKFDLEFIIEEKDDELEITLLYNSDIYDAKFIGNVQTHLNIAIETCIKNPKESLYQLPFLTQKEEKELIYDFNDTVQDYSKSHTFLDIFKEQVTNQPNAIAVIDEKQQYSYKELYIISSQIAAYLNANFDNEKEVIGVLLDRSAITIVVLLGILKSGRAYIPLDPTFPVDRLKYIIEHSELTVLISSEELSEITTDKINTLTANEVLSNSFDLDDTIFTNPTGSDTAYIIYTSGSTGNPKGVEVGHRSLLNFLLSIKNEPGIKNTDTLFAVTTYSFDISILEFFTPLISGATVYFVSNETLADPEKTIRLLEEVKPTIIQATPSFYQQLFSAGWNGDNLLKILCGGDVLSESLANQLLKSSLELWNMYGPTETTIWSTIKKIEKSNEANIIGKPIANTSLYVLDEFLQLRPNGSTGNLFIGGDGLAKGYYKQQELTNQRFVKNPFDDGLIYETGDVVKWNENGELVFLGRNDNQVKIRGYRIELGDIETKLNEIQDVKTAIVVAKKDTFENSFLVAYFTSENNLDINSLRSQLKEALPYYMIPSKFIKLDTFPLTPNKKIDRKALSNLENSNLVSSVEYLPPNSETEKKLVLLWNDVLGVEQIGLKDNLFDLGGHSLSVTKLVSSIQREFSIKVSLNKIFEHPILEEQSRLIENIQIVSQNNITHDQETEFESFSV